MAPLHGWPTLVLGMPRCDAERSEYSQPATERPRCVACRDVIGVYEPLVHVLGNLVWRTSLAAEPGVVGAGGTLYHLDCHTRLADG
jgi:hypothetical protein